MALPKGEEKVLALLKQSSKLNTIKVDDEKLPSKQRLIIQINRCIILLKAKEYKQCHFNLLEIIKNFPLSVLPILIQSSLLYIEKKSNEAIDLLKNYIQQHSTESSVDNTLSAHLLLIQILVNNGQIKDAITSMTSLSSRIYYNQPLNQHPAFVATLVSLYESDHQDDAAEALLTSSSRTETNVE